MAISKILPRLSTGRALRRFGFRQTRRGAVIIGLLVGLMMGAQGAAYAAAYPDQHSRDIFVTSLKGAPALGFMAGEIDDASTPASYSIYKSIALTTLIVAVWGLLTATRLLRGQEEDGRWEVIIAGTTTKRSASWQILIGYGYSFTIAGILAFVGIAGLGTDPKVNLSPTHSALLTLGVFLPGLFFAALGIFTSQLAITRQRAMLYGLVPLLILFAIRGAGNTTNDLNWLKQLTPFGWTDLLNPVLDPHAIWVVPPVLFAIVATGWGMYLAGRRDLGASLIRESDTKHSRFYLLGSPSQLAFRQSMGNFFWWLLGTVSFGAMLAALTDLAANALSSSPMARVVIAHLGGSLNDLKVAFLGFGATFTVLILLVMATIGLAMIRHDEAKGYLDNLLVQPTPRSFWLGSRLTIVIAMFTFISLTTSYVTWAVAVHQGITVDLGTMLRGAISMVGTVILTLGIGTLLYGILPRLAVGVMYAVIIWAFVVDVLKALFTSLNELVIKSSLFYYISTSPNKEPDWPTFIWLVGIGVGLIVIGIIGFSKRDIITE